MSVQMTDSEVVSLLREYCGLQERLVADFLSTLRPTDLEFFRGIRSGELVSVGRVWRYQKHGRGVRFSEGRDVVDAHSWMVTFPSAVDESRLWQFLEGRGMAALEYKGRVHSADEFVELRELFETLAGEGEFCEVSSPIGTKLFVPAEAGSASQ